MEIPFWPPPHALSPWTSSTQQTSFFVSKLLRPICSLQCRLGLWWFQDFKLSTQEHTWDSKPFSIPQAFLSLWQTSLGGVTFQQIKQKATVWTDCSRSSVLEARQYRFILMRKLHKWLFYESFTDKYQRILHTWSRKSKHKYKNEPTEICFMTFTQDFQLSLTTGSTFNKLPLLAFHSCALFHGLWRHH